MPVKSGKEYIERINNNLPDVRIAGRKVSGDISEHEAFKGLVATQANMYDMQVAEELKERLVFSSPSTGNPVGLSYMQPRTMKDLVQRRIMMETWASVHHGFLGRAPDYMNTAIMAYASAAGVLEEEYPAYASNLKRYQEYCRENDITLSHVFIQPKAARMSTFLRTFKEPEAARVMDKNKDGIVVRGAFLLDTQGATSDEILVYPTPFSWTETEDNPYSFVFAVPSNLEGIRFICRESFSAGDSSYDYPLSSRFEEMDTLVVFDDVTIPWNRVFVCGDERMASRLMTESHFHVHAGTQIICKNIAKTEFMLGTIEMLVEATGINNHEHIIEKVTEVIVAVETLKAFQLAAEKGAAVDRWGSMLPNRKPLIAANVFYQKMYPRIIEIIQLIGASNLIMIPHEQDFNTDIRAQLDRYMKGIDLDAKKSVQLARLAWELSVSSFGGRQSVYERFFFGNSTVVNKRLYAEYQDCRAKYADRVNRFLT